MKRRPTIDNVATRQARSIRYLATSQVLLGVAVLIIGAAQILLVATR